jgi:3-hydroxyisobutyrate dehydrogenase-like beta-hydroxyacid dehydrogenase
MQTIGFIGVGAMGSPMAMRLHQAGHPLIVFDPSTAALAPFESAGARIARTASDCAAAEIVILMVQNDAQLRESVLGEHGVLAGIGAGRDCLIAVMSTVLPETIRVVAERSAAKNVRLIDAPVSGGVGGARAGTLSIMAGGAEADLEKARPVFEVLSKNIFYCGGLGAGELTKIINNLLGVANAYLLAEALSLGKQHGLDLGRLVSIMDASSGRCFGTQDWQSQSKVYDAFVENPGAMKPLTDVCRKDLAHVVAMARSAGVPAPLANHLLQALTETTYDDFQRQWARISELGRKAE